MKMSEFFKAVLVTGARQVGKTTLLRHLTSGQSRAYVTLDNRAARELAQEDPALFFQTYKPPVLIDEVQFAPNLFPQIKTLCDESEETGLFWLTGSQQYQLMEVARESLAGRMSILTLYGLSQAEKAGVDFGDTLDFSLACLLKRQKQVERNDVAAVYEHIWQGGMPQIFHADPEQRQEYYHSYLNTYIMRDIAELGDVTDTLRFGKFITACAALVGQMVNYRTLAEASDISEPTAKNWLYLLEGLGIVFLLRPYANNALKRLVKTPKLYFCDTGLAAHLSMWPTAQTLQNGAASGAFFENYVVMELLKGHASAPITANMSYYRDSNMKEIDLFVETNGRIHPLEIKKSATPDRREIKKFSILEKTTLETGEGGIVCMCQEPMPIDALNCYIPCNLI
jgi:predicted AAA+ superfamily ATPase